MESIRDRVERRAREKQNQLRRVGELYRAMNQARDAYDEALVQAHEMGIPTTSIALEVDRTEAGVRLYLKRRLEGRSHK